MKKIFYSFLFLFIASVMFITKAKATNYNFFINYNLSMIDGPYNYTYEINQVSRYQFSICSKSTNTCNLFDFEDYAIQRTESSYSYKLEDIRDLIIYENPSYHNLIIVPIFNKIKDLSNNKVYNYDDYYEDDLKGQIVGNLSDNYFDAFISPSATLKVDESTLSNNDKFMINKMLNKVSGGIYNNYYNFNNNTFSNFRYSDFYYTMSTNYRKNDSLFRVYKSTSTSNINLNFLSTIPILGGPYTFGSNTYNITPLSFLEMPNITLKPTQNIKFVSGFYQYNDEQSDVKTWSLDFSDYDGNNYVYEYSYDGVNYSIYDKTKSHSTNYNLDIYARVRNNEEIISSKVFHITDLLDKPDYLEGYKLVFLDTNTKALFLSGVSSGRIYIPMNDFIKYGGLLSYYDKDAENLVDADYTIKEYENTNDAKYVYQEFDLTNFEGADFLIFNKFIYLENIDYQDFAYYIYVPNDMYVSKSRPVANNEGGNDFEYEYINENGEIEYAVIHNDDLNENISEIKNFIINQKKYIKAFLDLFSQFYNGIPKDIQMIINITIVVILILGLIYQIRRH